MDMVTKYIQELKNMKARKILLQLVTLAMIVGSALMIWKTLMLITKSESPVVVVLSGSMEPAYYRGDILFLTFYDDPIVPGDVVVFKLKEQEIPIVHRVIAVQEKEENEIYILTKGDNNSIDDRGLYARGQLWLNKSDLMGRVRGYLPYIGMVTIWLNDYPMLKWVLIGLMSLFVIIAKDPQS